MQNGSTRRFKKLTQTKDENFRLVSFIQIKIINLYFRLSMFLLQDKDTIFSGNWWRTSSRWYQEHSPSSTATKRKVSVKKIEIYFIFVKINCMQTSVREEFVMKIWGVEKGFTGFPHIIWVIWLLITWIRADDWLTRSPNLGSVIGWSFFYFHPHFTPYTKFLIYFLKEHKRPPLYTKKEF